MSQIIDLAFAGKLKAVKLGFEYFSRTDVTDDTQLAFSITGQHVFNSGAVNWSSSIGCTGRSFAAAVEISGQQNSGNNKLAMER